MQLQLCHVALHISDITVWRSFKAVASGQDLRQLLLPAICTRSSVMLLVTDQEKNSQMTVHLTGIAPAAKGGAVTHCKMPQLLHVTSPCSSGVQSCKTIAKAQLCCSRAMMQLYLACATVQDLQLRRALSVSMQSECCHFAACIRSLLDPRKHTSGWCGHANARNTGSSSALTCPQTHYQQQDDSEGNAGSSSALTAGSAR